jgi:hypothetical protein
VTQPFITGVLRYPFEVPAPWLGSFSSKALAEDEADRYALECLTPVREDLAE